MDADSKVYLTGVLLAVLTACVNSTGMGLQKRVHLDLAALPLGAPRPYWRDRRWMAGLGCMALASTLVLVNYGILGQARASAMSALTIVTNALMAKYYLREAFTLLDLAATCFIIGGIITAVIFGASAGAAELASLKELLALMSNNAVYGASAFIVALVAALTLFIRHSDRFETRKGRRSRRLRGFECFARALLAGIFSGSTGFFAKAVTYAVRDSAATHDARGSIGNAEFYIFLLGLPFSIFMQLKTLNEGLRIFDTVEIVPMYQASIVVVGVSWGWTFYQENKDLARLDEFKFAAGVLVSVFGIGLLTFKKPRDALASVDAAHASADVTTALISGVTDSRKQFLVPGAVYESLETECDELPELGSESGERRLSLSEQSLIVHPLG